MKPMEEQQHQDRWRPWPHGPSTDSTHPQQIFVGFSSASAFRTSAEACKEERKECSCPRHPGQI